MFRNLVVFTFMLIGSASFAVTNGGASSGTAVSKVLAQVVVGYRSGSDPLEIARLNNQLLRLGIVAVEELIAVLGNENSDIYARWSAALILGELGDERAIPVMTGILNQPRFTANGFLQDICTNSLGQIRGTLKREGKIYFYKITNRCERVDPDTGEKEACPTN